MQPIEKKVSLNLNVRGLSRSSTLAINEQVAELRAQGRDVISLGLGQSPFPVPTDVVNSLKVHAAEKDYLPVQGLPALRQVVAEFHQRRDRVNAREDLVMVGPGSKELMFLLQLSFYGDLVIPTPSWVSYVPQATIIGRQIRMIHTLFEDDWRVTGETLQAFLLDQKDQFRPRILILNYPSNPDGGSYSDTQLRELAAVAREHDILLLSDEIYGLLHHEGNHVSVARFYPEGTILSSGLSKWCGAGGWRLGTFTFPPELRWLLEAMCAVASETYTSVSAPIQYAAIAAFQGSPAIETYLHHSRRVLSSIARFSVGRLRRAGLRVLAPHGAFYLFPDFTAVADGLRARGINTSGQLCEVVLDELDVAMLPGQDFGRPATELTVRMAYVDFDGTEALKVSEATDGHLDETFVRRCAPRVADAMDRIGAWAEKID